MILSQGPFIRKSKWQGFERPNNGCCVLIHFNTTIMKIVYYVASSVNGFICGPNEDVSDFVFSGNGVDKYLEDLRLYSIVIMGRRTYEFGYRFGAVPGQPSPAYPHMKHYIFSTSLKFDEQSEQVVVKRPEIEHIHQLKREAETDIYLCGGGTLAGWLLENQQIDILKVKLNPLILGNGIRLFEKFSGKYKLRPAGRSEHEHGLQILTFEFLY